MLITTEEAYKEKIIQRLTLAKSQIEQILLSVESDNDWNDINPHIEIAIIQLKNATKLLAQYHLKICTIGKYRKKNIPTTHEDIEEIMKTYRYLN